MPYSGVVSLCTLRQHRSLGEEPEKGKEMTRCSRRELGGNEGSTIRSSRKAGIEISINSRKPFNGNKFREKQYERCISCRKKASIFPLCYIISHMPCIYISNSLSILHMNGNDSESDLKLVSVSSSHRISTTGKNRCSITYNRSEYHNAEERHPPIEISPPSCVFVPRFVDLAQGLFEIAS